jgi:hypothetical protein
MVYPVKDDDDRQRVKIACMTCMVERAISIPQGNWSLDELNEWAQQHELDNH